MWYFDTTPLGRVLNRFTYDVEQVDITLSQFMSIFIIATSWLIAGQIVMIVIVPFMVFVNAVVLVAYVLVLRHYRWSAADLQRLDAVSRSPIQASLAEGLDGSFTIRAFGKIEHFAEEFQSFIDDNSSAMMHFVASRRWLAVRLETLGAFVTLGASLAITLYNEQLGLTPGLCGLLVIWASSMTVTLSFLINAFSEVEAAITSIERMHSMELLPQEASMVTSRERGVGDSWPQKGVLVLTMSSSATGQVCSYL
jgi:ABC-type multidrug transport system fused ATPase/permease subunit